MWKDEKLWLLVLFQLLLLLPPSGSQPMVGSLMRFWVLKNLLYMLHYYWPSWMLLLLPLVLPSGSQPVTGPCMIFWALYITSNVFWFKHRNRDLAWVLIWIWTKRWAVLWKFVWIWALISISCDWDLWDGTHRLMYC